MLSRLTLLFSAVPVLATFNWSYWQALSYVQTLLDESSCLRASSNGPLAPCAPTGGAAGFHPHMYIKSSFTGLLGQHSQIRDRHSGECNLCHHGAHMIPFLIRRYGARHLAEVGVCTGMSVVNVVARVQAAQHEAAVSGREAELNDEGLERYYMIDPWGSNRCKPGCGCSRQVMHAHTLSCT
jgi:hypothetical protein